MKKIFFIVLLLMIVGGFYYFFKIKNGELKQAPDGAVSLEFPLKGGSFQAVQSGQNGSTHNLPIEKYALDIVRQGKVSDYFKFRQYGLESNPTFGTLVYSPCAGDVINVIDSFPDMPIGIRGQASEANRVTVNCGQFNVALVHFKKGSVLIKIGDKVKSDQPIGLIGNSGASDAPHLHIMAYRFGSSPDDRIALPITFNGKYLFRGDIYP